MTTNQTSTATITITRTDGTVIRTERVLIGAGEQDPTDLEVDALHAAAYAAVRRLRATPLVPPMPGRHADDADTMPHRQPAWAQPRTGQQAPAPSIAGPLFRPEPTDARTTIIPRVDAQGLPVQQLPQPRRP